jgi:hypothetical protein
MKNNTGSFNQDIGYDSILKKLNVPIDDSAAVKPTLSSPIRTPFKTTPPSAILINRQAGSSAWEKADMSIPWTAGFFRRIPKAD